MPTESYFSQCPACGGAVVEYAPASDDEYESWLFACHGEVLRMSGGRFVQNGPCNDALRFKLNTINKALADNPDTDQ